jgi:parvulin-like peptidyl-prolyl isomerase
MIPPPDSPEFGPHSLMATLPDVSLSLGELLVFLRRRSHLKSPLLEALSEKLIRLAAREAGLSVSTEELQQAANRFRQQQGLRTAEDTHAWLQQNGLRLIDLEALLEQAQLGEKFRNHLTEGRLEEHWAAEADRYARARISHFTVPTEGLARELLARIHSDGADFDELAQQHALPGSGARGNGVVMRTELPAEVADVVFRARPDSVVGPVSSQQGWHLFHVHERLPPQRDEPTMARIRQDLFNDWLRERLANVRIDLSGLDQP